MKSRTLCGFFTIPTISATSPMLEVVANALRSPHARLIESSCGYYQNRKGEWGVYLTLWDAGHYHMISVSHIDSIPTNEEVAKALTSSEAHVVNDGRYPNRKGTLGYYATVRSGDHWYMISICDMLQPYHSQWWADRVG